MKIILSFLLFWFQSLPSPDQSADDVVAAAQERTRHFVIYDPSYVSLSYPNGDVPEQTGVCTDVIIRTYRAALNFDFQKAVHEDMKSNFSAYPADWGLSRTDRNIDHRRVPNLETFLTRAGAALPITDKAKDYLPGDIVSWRLLSGAPHIGIVTDRTTKDGIPLIVHNIGLGVREDDMLFQARITGHFRYFPSSNISD